MERCLQSILEQTFSDFEVIVTDDSPNGEVRSVIDKYAKDKRLQYFKNEFALGSPENWNEGLRCAKGEYVKIMHHDDWLNNPNSLQTFVNVAKDSDADFIVSSCNNVGPSQTKAHHINKRFRKKWANNNSLILYANYLGNPSTTFFKRHIDSKLNFDVKSLWYVDVIFYYEYKIKHPKIAYIDDILVDTSAGLDTQVTNSAISAKVGVGEFIYVVEKYNLFQRNPFLTHISLLEVLKRYGVTDIQHLEQLLGKSFNRKIPFEILRLPIHHQIYNIIKHICLLA
ncbi:glycosyltransferase involved in cell wall biosynthesis [Dyadobacter jejuensis]|uniref:Glycosyltransferase involved in cell wall biosynthesis n=1 Tax=Dyadobacter jejuensis TaxID=1082580 RepID=A0A316AS15_9BACT|nr:glycosyltransferase involved in cell wall biosynthesis [Dyadobacter jejuensis]